MFEVLNKNGEVVAFLEDENGVIHIPAGEYTVQTHIDPEPAPPFVFNSLYGVKAQGYQVIKQSIPPPYQGGTVAELAEVFPNITSRVPHPRDGKSLPINEIIISLNDNYHWSRQKIADWLESLDVDLTVTSGEKGR